MNEPDIAPDLGGEVDTAAPATVSPPMVAPAPPAPEPPKMPEVEPEPHAVEPIETFFTEGCYYVGGYDRVFVYQRDAMANVCSELVLIADDEASPFDLTNLTVPAPWTVETMTAYACTPEGMAVNGATPTHYTRATGSVTFAAAQGGWPPSISVDVLISVPAADAGTLSEQLIMDRRIVALNLDLAGGCSGRR